MADLEAPSFTVSRTGGGVFADFTVKNNTNSDIETTITFDSDAGNPDDFGSADISPGTTSAGAGIGDFVQSGDSATVELNADGYGTLATATVSPSNSSAGSGGSSGSGGSNQPANTGPDLEAPSFTVSMTGDTPFAQFTVKNNTNSDIETTITFTSDAGNPDDFGGADISPGTTSAGHDLGYFAQSGGQAEVKLNADGYGTLASDTVTLSPALEVNSFTLDPDTEGNVYAEFEITNNTPTAIDTSIEFVDAGGGTLLDFGSADISPGTTTAGDTIPGVGGESLTVELYIDGFGVAATEYVTVPTPTTDKSELVLESINIQSPSPGELAGEVVVGNRITSGDGEDITTKLRFESPNRSFSHTYGNITVEAFLTGSDPTVVEFSGVSGFPTDVSSLQVCAVTDRSGRLGCDSVSAPKANFQIVDISAPDVIDPEEYPAAFDV